MSAQKPTILLISLFHPELVRGGAQQVAYELFEGLRARGDCRPVFLAAIDQKFAALYKSGARITGFDGRPDEYVLLSRDYDHTWHKTGSAPNMEALETFLLQIAPDVVHVHHFLMLGIDVLTLIRRVLPRCRLVFTFHEFMAICAANGHMVRRTDGSLCTLASQVRCHQCFPDRGPEQFLLRKMWFQQHLSRADALTCPSAFMIDQFVRWGVPSDRISHVTNGQRDYAGGHRLPAASGGRNRFGFFGQYVDVKGVQLILRAVSLLRAEGFSDFSVDLNGDNLRYASEAVRGEIEAFLAEEATSPGAGPHRDRSRFLRGDTAARTHVARGLVHRAQPVVGKLRSGDLGSVHVRPTGHLLGRGRHGRTNTQRRVRPAFFDGRPPRLGRDDAARLHRGGLVGPPGRRRASPALAGDDG